MNSDDLFAELILQPHPLVAIRGDVHWPDTSARDDLWYAGGGASNAKLFGFSGIATGDERDLGQLAGVAVTLGPWRRLWLSTYYGHAFDGPAIRNVFAGESANYFYTELTFRY